MARRNSSFSLAIKTEGGLLPADYLSSIASLSTEVEGLTPDDYHLSEREKINEAINRAYSRLQGFWTSFQDALAKLPSDDYATSTTKDKWLLPLFECLGYGRLVTAEPVIVGDRQYRPSHMWSHVPIHLVGFRVDLDRRSTAGGARSASPHSLVQELLNQSDDHLWALLSNGRKLRLLRDNASLTRQAFIEFDLESMFEGDGYSDFRLLWLLCHQSRFEGSPPETCWLERWSKAAQLTGVRVRDQLRNGVEKALEILGTGFLRHRANDQLRMKVRAGEITAEEYYRQLLRLIYRLLFLFVTEDKNALLNPAASSEQRRVYYHYYATSRLRALAGKRRGTQHDDLWSNLLFIFSKLSGDSGCAELGLPALGSFLWSANATPDFELCRLYNADLLEALRNLCYTVDSGVRRPVQYGQLESEELGSIYESLLEQIPLIDASTDMPVFGLRQSAGSERKTTGSYYTPTSLVNCLLDSALEPVLNSAIKAANPEVALLNLKVCDPACGSGHFIIAAAHRIAKRLASVRTGDVEPGPEYTSVALRDVISRCIYGVDVNELAVELCKVSLWLQSAIPGQPLSFLDHKIRCGNSLVGATPSLIDNGIPDAALDPLEGDDRETVRRVKAANRQETDAHVIPGFLKYDVTQLEQLSATLRKLDESPEISISDVHKKETAYSQLLASDAYLHERYVSDAWCAAFVWKLAPGAPSPITRAVFGRIRSDYRNVAPEVRNEIVRLREQYKFFHWHLEFPQVFAPATAANSRSASKWGWIGGFDVVLGNPPWERVKLQEQEWFAPRVPEIAAARTAAIRGRMIANLERTNPALHREFIEDRRKAEGESHFVRKSGRFPLCGRGDVNTYSIFAETFRDVLEPKGFAGFIVPSGIATDDTTKLFFADLVEKRELVSLYDFENRRGIFPGVHRSYKFSLLTLAGVGAEIRNQGTDFLFFALDTVDLLEEDRHFTLTAEDLAVLNPNTRTCAIFRSKKDAELTKAIYSRIPVLIKEGPPEDNLWKVTFGRMFDMANDSGSFRTRASLEQAGFSFIGGNIFERHDRGGGTERYLPLYEAKMIHQFDHRWATYDYSSSSDDPNARDVTDEEKANVDFVVLPRYWVLESEVGSYLSGKTDSAYLLGWRDVCRNTDERTMISSIIPRYGVGDKFLLLFSEHEMLKVICLAANFNSLIFDYIARQKIGGTAMKYFTVRQLATIAPAVWDDSPTWCEGQHLKDWVSSRAISLFCSNVEMRQLATVAINEPMWDPERRFHVRCELDAAFFVLYGLSLPDVEFVIDSFPVLRDKEVRRYGTFRTKERVLSLTQELLRKNTVAAAGAHSN